MPNFETITNGGGAFKAGPNGRCQICGNRAELGAYADGRMICEDCWQAMDHGRKTREPSAPMPEAETLAPTFTTSAPVAAVTLTWAQTDADERANYLSTIASASPALIKEVISNLVSSGSLELDFHKIIQNERWFSLMDLRRIASRVQPPALHEKVTANSRRKKCPKTSKTRTPKIRIPLPPLQELLQPQHLQTLQSS